MKFALRHHNVTQVRKLIFLFLTSLLTGVSLPPIDAAEVNAPLQNAEFTLTEMARTSAGVYSKDGVLIRTLWSNQETLPGTHEIAWDGLDDWGTPVDHIQELHAEIVTHNVSYVWQGVIGNTSTELTGPTKYRGNTFPHDLAFDRNGYGYFAFGYNEGVAHFHRITQDDYQARDTWGPYLYKENFRYVATDGEKVYHGNTGTGWDGTGFLLAQTLDQTSRNISEYPFPKGELKDNPEPEQDWLGVLLKADTAEGTRITGIAAQENGNLLVTAHGTFKGWGNGNCLRIWDKYSGELLNTVDATNPRAIDFAPDGTLWAIAKNSSGNDQVLHYSFEDGVPELNRIIDFPFSLALDITVSFDGKRIVVIDGLDAQQIHEFNNDGQYVNSHGIKGGYPINGPAVTDEKFHFAEFGDNRIPGGFAAFSPNGNLWIGDVGNARILIYDQNWQTIDRIAFLPTNYSISIDQTNPNRLFARFFEYEVSYTDDIRSDWKLIANHGTEIIDDLHINHALRGITKVAYLTFGETTKRFCFIPKKDIVAEYELWEIFANRNPRKTNLTFTRTDCPTIHGSNRIRMRREVDGHQLIYDQVLVGFDENEDPIFEGEEIVADVPMGENDPYFRSEGYGHLPKFPTTSSGKVVFFDRSLSNKGYHLGACLVNGSDWLWRASRGGVAWERNDSIAPYEERGLVINADGSYDTESPRTIYGGNQANVFGNNIIYGYHGEFWNIAQANQFLHFFENGLFVGQFGRAAYPTVSRRFALEGVAGNSFSSEMVEVDGQLYLWHNDESVHGGVHRWEVKNSNSIRVLKVPFSPTTDSTEDFAILYSEWINRFNLSSELSIPIADPDSDGNSNYEEYIYGTSPSEWNQLISQFEISEIDQFGFSIILSTPFPIHNPEFEWQISFDLGSWSRIIPSLQQDPESDENGNVTQKIYFQERPEGPFNLRRIMPTQ